MPGIGPAVIEDIFALAVAFGIGRQGTHQPPARALDHQRHRLPAAAPADAAGFLEQRQEGVADKGIPAVGQRIPLVRRQRAN